MSMRSTVDSNFVRMDYRLYSCTFVRELSHNWLFDGLIFTQKSICVKVMYLSIYFCFQTIAVTFASLAIDVEFPTDIDLKEASVVFSPLYLVCIFLLNIMKIDSNHILILFSSFLLSYIAWAIKLVLLVIKFRSNSVESKSSFDV